ncbi:hypothetical protein ACP275_14G029000 [Erythranthe tilingii]
MMACFERASPALMEILLKIHRAERPVEIDYHVHEFGSVHYHVQCSASDPHCAYLSISTPLLSRGLTFSSQLPEHILETVNGIFPRIIETIELSEEGYQLTLKLDFSRIPHGKASTKIITEISSVRAVILSSHLKEILTKADSNGMYKPIKLVYHPSEPFFLIKQQAKITAVFPMRFKENEDVVIATAFFQELTDVGNSEKCRKAPRCIWSPIPPPELRGESIEDLCTNCGFVTFDITSRHVEGKKLDKTVWNLLNFYTFVKYYVKSTRGFIQRRMRLRLEKLMIQPLHDVVDVDQEDRRPEKKAKGCKRVKKWITASKSKIVRKRQKLMNKIKRIRFRIKIHSFVGRFRRRWLKMPKFSRVTRYMKLE